MEDRVRDYYRRMFDKPIPQHRVIKGASYYNSADAVTIVTVVE